jgi:hypothetical protein
MNIIKLSQMASKYASHLPEFVVEVHFQNDISRDEFEAAWTSRTGGPPVDKIINGVQYSGDNADSI